MTDNLNIAKDNLYNKGFSIVDGIYNDEEIDSILNSLVMPIKQILLFVNRKIYSR